VRGEQTLNWGLLVVSHCEQHAERALPHQPMTLYDAAALYRQLERGLERQRHYRHHRPDTRVGNR
jgi:hypothetical protein